MSKNRKWRQQVKKLRRKRIRQKLATERYNILKEEEKRLLNDPIYQEWLKQQEILEELQREFEQKQHDEEEEKWLRRELLAQKQFREEQKRRQEIEKSKEAERARILKEFEDQRRLVKQKQEEKKRLAEEQQRKHKRLLEKIKEYMENGGEIPEELHETADTNPGKELCTFFCKTASCRFGDKCSRNHSRPGISKILLLSHFFNHIRLEQSKNTEYGNDLPLEYSDSELHNDYKEFFDDVVPELEKYGRIENFRACNNCEPHLRGNVYVEYCKERDALKAFIALQGRYYAGKRINVEFATVPSWKAAICGLSLSKRCPKGKSCNFLHIFKNPLNKYDSALNIVSSHRNERTATRKDTTENESPSWNDIDDDKLQQRNWRWSESPEKSIRNRESSSRYSRKRSRSKSPSKRRYTRSPEYAHRRRLSNSRSPLKTSRRTSRRRTPSSSRSQLPSLKRSRSKSLSTSREYRNQNKKNHKSHNRKLEETKEKRRSRDQSKSPTLTKFHHHRRRKKKKKKS